MRIYDDRLGRFLSVDPLTKNYPFYTPYQFAGNNPINYIDLDGGEPGIPQFEKFKYEGNAVQQTIQVVDNFAFDLINGGISLLNTSVDLAHTITDGTWNSRDVKAAFVEMGQNAKYNAKAQYTYFTKTPVKQQIKDIGTTLKSPEFYENTMVLGASLYMAADGATPIKAEVPLYLNPTEFVKVTSENIVPAARMERVGQWMSKGEYEQFIKTGDIPRSNVLTKGKEGYMSQADKGDYYVEFNMDKSNLRPTNDKLGWAKIKSKNPRS